MAQPTNATAQVDIHPTLHGFHFNVKAFGAVGDGVTDDHTAIAAAITAASAVGGIVYFPTGEFVDSAPQTVASGKSIRIVGANRAYTIWRYSGNTQQAFLTFGGGNQGSAIEHICITGAKADPVVDIRSVPTYTYNSFLFFTDCFIGYCMQAGVALNGTTYLAYSGINVKCDVFRMNETTVWGRNYGLRLRASTTDAYLTNCAYSSLPQGGESRGIALWCEDVATNEWFQGTLMMVNCTVAQGTECAMLLRSIAYITNLYCESSPLPIKAVVGNIKIFGGTIGTDKTAANYVIYADTCSGAIIQPHMFAPTGANSMTNMIRTVNSYATQTWDVQLNKREMTGTLPATLTNIDSPYRVSIQGLDPQGITAITVTASPFTYTNTSGVPQAIYIFGGTVSQIAKNSVNLFTSTDKTIFLQPTESVVVTYSSAPTMKADWK